MITRRRHSSSSNDGNKELVLNHRTAAKLGLLTRIEQDFMKRRIEFRFQNRVALKKVPAQMLNFVSF